MADGPSARTDRDGGAGSAIDPGNRRDRQIVVVGSGLAAAACGGYLAQAGFDPLVAPAPGGGWRADTDVVSLWYPGLVLLERLGLRRPIERIGKRLRALDCGGHTARADPRDRPALVAVGRDRLVELLDRRVFARLRTVDTPVAALEPAGSNVTVTFEGSSPERFDLAVASSRSVHPAGGSSDGQDPVHRWGFEWPEDVASPAVPTEGWLECDAAFTTPAADRTAVELVSAGDFPPSAVLDRGILRERFGPALPEAGSVFDALDGTALSYRRTAPGVCEPRVADRTALIGAAVRPSGLGNPLTPSLAVGDAWVVADALAHGPHPIPAALEAYRRRRRRREDRVRASSPPARPDGPVERCPVLARLAEARALAFGHVIGDELPAAARRLPRRL